MTLYLTFPPPSVRRLQCQQEASYGRWHLCSFCSAPFAALPSPQRKFVWPGRRQWWNVCAAADTNAAANANADTIAADTTASNATATDTTTADTTAADADTTATDATTNATTST